MAEMQHLMLMGLTLVVGLYVLLQPRCDAPPIAPPATSYNDSALVNVLRDVLTGAAFATTERSFPLEVASLPRRRAGD